MGTDTADRQKSVMRSCLRSSIALALAVVASGCATSGSEVTAVAASSAVSSKPLPTPTFLHTVQRNERLSDIALELTGDADNWTAIAEHNGIRNARRLSVGATLEIPGHLIDPEIGQDADWAAVPPAAEPAPPILAQRPVAEPEAADVVVSAVTTNKAFDLIPLAAGVSSARASTRYVKVVGSYFPKGVYTHPDSASRLVMRLAPGTVLTLDREYDGWFKVETSEGEGYLRVADGEVLRRAPAS